MRLPRRQVVEPNPGSAYPSESAKLTGHSSREICLELGSLIAAVLNHNLNAFGLLVQCGGRKVVGTVRQRRKVSEQRDLIPRIAQVRVHEDFAKRPGGGIEVEYHRVTRLEIVPEIQCDRPRRGGAKRDVAGLVSRAHQPWGRRQVLVE